MAGKFLKRGAIIDTIKSEERMNARQKRNGLTQHPVRVTSCGCPDPNCGAFHVLLTECVIPNEQECAEIISKANVAEKLKRMHQRVKPMPWAAIKKPKNAV